MQREVHQGLPQGFHVHAPIDRHQAAANLVIGSVDRDREVHSMESVRSDELRQSSDTVDSSNGGDRDVPTRNRWPVVIDQNPDRLEHLVEVVHWFPHSHEHDVLDLVAKGVSGREPLADDLGGAEITYQTHLRRLAEAAPHGASDLTRDAEGSAVSSTSLAHRYEYGLRLLARLQLLGELDRVAFLLGPRQGHVFHMNAGVLDSAHPVCGSVELERDGGRTTQSSCLVDELCTGQLKDSECPFVLCIPAGTDRTHPVSSSNAGSGSTSSSTVGTEEPRP